MRGDTALARLHLLKQEIAVLKASGQRAMISDAAKSLAMKAMNVD